MTIKNIVSGQLATVAAYSNTTGTVSGITTPHSNLGSNANFTISGGALGQVLTTDGAGTLSWSYHTGAPGGLPSQVQFNGNGAFTGSGNLRFTGNTAVSVIGNITATADIIAANISGNGAGISALPSANVIGQVANALVAGTVYTAAQPNITSTGTLTALTVAGNSTAGNVTTGGQVVATGNISGSYFLGNGSQITGLPTPYSNTLANSFLAAGLSGNIRPAGNSLRTLGNTTNQFSNLYMSNSALYMNGLPITMDSNNTLIVNSVPVIQGGANNTSNIATTGNISGAAITAAGNITANGGYFFIGNGSQISNVQPMNGNLLINGNSNVFAYANSNIAVSITSTGNIANFTTTGLTVANSVTAGNIAGTTVLAGNGNILLNANTIASNIANMTLDPNNDGAANTGNVNILGNLNVTGTLSYTDIGNTITNDPTWIAANNAVSLSAASGAGLAFGPNGSYGQFTYNYSSNIWFSTLGISTPDNLTATNANVTGNLIIGNGSRLTGLPGSKVTGQVANALVVGTVYTGAQPNITSVGTLTNANISGTATAAHFSGEAGNLSNIAAGNVVGTFPLATTLTGNAQANITSVGTLTSLVVAANTTTNALVSTGAITANGNVSVTGSGELIVTTNNDHGGANYAGIMTMTNTNSGVPTPNKFLRISPAGDLEVINSGYTNRPLGLTDSGNLSITGIYSGNGAQLSNVTALRANNIIGGSSTDMLIQTAPSTTGFFGPGTPGQLLINNGPTVAPVWTDVTDVPIPRAYAFSVTQDWAIADLLASNGITETAGLTLTISNTTNTGVQITFPGLTNWDTVGGALAASSTAIDLGFNASVTVQCVVSGSSYTIMTYTGSSYEAASGRIFSINPDGSNQLPYGSDTILPFQGYALYDNINLDLNGWIDNTNHRFTPNLSGYWLIKVSMSGTTNSTPTGGLAKQVYWFGNVNVQIRKNDNSIAIGTGVSISTRTSGVHSTVMCQTVVYLNGAGDYINFTGYAGGGLNFYLDIYNAVTMSCTLIK